MVTSNRDVGMATRVRQGRVKSVTRPVESVVNTQFRDATLTELMNSPSEFALCTGDQLECAGEAEQDRQQRSHLQPVKQQANVFETHFLLPSVWVLSRPRRSGSIG